jgi:hypothetical protein
MTWTVQRQRRPNGGYYSAVAKGEGKQKSRSVTIGRIEGEPEPYPLTLRLRSIVATLAGQGIEPSDEVIASVVRARSDEDARITAAMLLSGLAEEDQEEDAEEEAEQPVPDAPPVPTPSGGIVPGTKEAYLTFR